MVLSNLTVGVTCTVTCKACNDVDNSTLSAASVTRDVELTVFLSTAWNGASGMTGCAAHTEAGLSPFSTASQMVTAKAPSLTPVFLCISPQDQTVVLNSCQRFLRVHNFDCMWPLENSRHVFTICALDVCGRASACKKTRVVLGVTNA